MFHHWPLPYHRLAYPLARASECAAAQGKFDVFYDSVYAHQDVLGVAPITEIGTMIKVGDPAAFSRCVRDTATVAVINADSRMARQIGLAGTPGVIIDGRIMTGAVTVPYLEQAFAAAPQSRRETRSP